MKYVFTSFFKEPRFKEGDPDAEWIACFIIDGESMEKCKAWGDLLAENYANRSSQIFYNSYVETLDEYSPSQIKMMPVIQEGKNATDPEIGW